MNSETWNQILAAAVEDRSVDEIFVAPIPADFSGLLSAYRTAEIRAYPTDPSECVQYLLSLVAVRPKEAGCLALEQLVALRKGNYVAAASGPRLRDNGAGLRNVLSRTLDALNAGVYAPMTGISAVPFETDSGFCLRFVTPHERTSAMGDLAAFEYLRDAAADGHRVRLETTDDGWVCHGGPAGSETAKNLNPATAVVELYGTQSLNRWDRQRDDTLGGK